MAKRSVIEFQENNSTDLGRQMRNRFSVSLPEIEYLLFSMATNFSGKHNSGTENRAETIAYKTDIAVIEITVH